MMFVEKSRFMDQLTVSELRNNIELSTLPHSKYVELIKSSIMYLHQILHFASYWIHITDDIRTLWSITILNT